MFVGSCRRTRAFAEFWCIFQRMFGAADLAVPQLANAHHMSATAQLQADDVPKAPLRWLARSESFPAAPAPTESRPGKIAGIFTGTFDRYLQHPLHSASEVRRSRFLRRRAPPSPGNGFHQCRVWRGTVPVPAYRKQRR